MKDNKSQNKLSYIDFLNDDEFLKWQLYKSIEQEEYWIDYVKRNPECEDAFEQAIEKFSKIKLNRKKLSDEETEKLYNKIVHSSQLRLEQKKKLKYYWTAAAVVIVLITSAVFTRLVNEQQHNNTSNPDLVITGEVMPEKDIQLISGSRIVNIDQNADLSLNAQGEISVLKESEVKESTYNTAEVNRLVVPYGKRSTLLLPDGTKVWLNSGTELEFPSNFETKERRIHVKGEIFIDVAENKNMPFYVQTPKLTVRVYGTTFNVSSYADSEESVVLVDGKVEIQAGSKILSLNPGELFSINQNKITHEKVDVNGYISWKDGFFIFNKIPISVILKKIGRYYNVNFNDSELKLSTKTCSGKLILSEDFEQVMDIICVISNTTYSRSDNTILISDKK
ncbi:FecR family protein [Dysgonomonas sp. Marseille-P4677]|uniref:FecR family protein n=1 Tax=Dysgonomonas sp. Marseille-P4677 TaxID=2364790 RepID=UPI00191414FA|nr:FecR family protein [Dysgonomonas sp. Marseille-P4677]MBK5723130.1 FecR family protein [Dysgonomonas sp. Marseille-P4677]